MHGYVDGECDFRDAGDVQPWAEVLRRNLLEHLQIGGVRERVAEGVWVRFNLSDAYNSLRTLEEGLASLHCW